MNDYPFSQFLKEYEKIHPRRGATTEVKSYLDRRVGKDPESQAWWRTLLDKVPTELRERLQSSDVAEVERALQEAEDNNYLSREEFHKEYLKKVEETSKARAKGAQEGKEEEEPSDPNNPLDLNLPKRK
jgi:hypothetical protein